MKIQLDYGKTGLNIEAPDENLKAVLNLQPSPSLSDPVRSIRKALDQPIGSPSLRHLSTGRKTACILICDITRPVPNEILLTPTLETLEAQGLSPADILILVATGLHRASTPEEIEEMLGPRIATRYRVESHDAREASAHVHLGTTSSGAPVWVDRRYVEANLKITTGLIEPHLMAGFSGGRKVICPGIVGVETLKEFHGVSILDAPLATAGEVEGNPVHEFSLEVARMAGSDFILNVALDESRKITGVFCGDMVEAWRQGVAHVRTTAMAPLNEPADIVVTTAAGYPLDNTFYQAAKGLVGAAAAVKPGGTLIMAAAMREGIGSAEYQELLAAHPSLDSLLNQIHEPGFFCIDQWQAQELARACKKADVHVYTDGPLRHRLSSLFVHPADSIESALAEAIQKHGPGASVVVIPRGPYVLPVVRGA